MCLKHYWQVNRWPLNIGIIIWEEGIMGFVSAIYNKTGF